jgi:hypothetical protein
MLGVSTGSYPRLDVSREGRLGLDIYKEYGELYVAKESFSSMFANRLLPWLRGVVDAYKTHMFDSSYADRQLDVRLTVEGPRRVPADARMVQKKPTKQYNLTATVVISYGTEKLWDHTILVPTPIRSRHCLTHGAGAVERQAMGVGAAETGGYVLNTKNCPTVVRPMETTHQARPKIITTPAALVLRRKTGLKHGDHALYVIADYVAELVEKGFVPPEFGEGYRFVQYIKGVLNPKKGEEDLVQTVATPTPAQAKAKAARRKKKIGSANAKADAALIGDSDYAALPPPTSPRPAAAGLDGGAALEMLHRIVRMVVVEQPGAKKAKPRPTPPVMEGFLAKCSYDNILALTTTTEIYAVGMVYYIWISLPKPNKKIHVQAKTYVPLALGPKPMALGGRLMYAFHALFYARDFLGGSGDEMIGQFMVVGGMRSYALEIREAIASVVDPEMVLGLEAALGASYRDYEGMVLNLSALEFFVSLFSDSPSAVSIYSPFDLVRHVTDFIVPLIGYVGDDKYLAKARSLATLLSALNAATETGGSSDLHAYKNKAIVTTGTTIFRFMRERLNLMIWTKCAKMTESNAQINAARKPDCILTSFSTHDGGHGSKGASGTQATMALPWETQLKASMMVRIIAVNGSAYVPQAARLIQQDQAGCVCNMFSPEGAGVGQRKDQTALGLISMYRDHELISRYLTAALASGGERGIAARREDVVGTDPRLLYVEAIPGYYVSREFFMKMRGYFRMNGPVRPNFPHPYGLQALAGARAAASRIQTFDIVFTDEESKYTIYHSGGLLGHLTLVAYGGTLAIDKPEYAQHHGSDPWRSGRVTQLIDDGVLAFVTPTERYFECSSVQKFYSLPSLRDMPVVDGKHTRDEAVIRGCKELCPWCWHLALPPSASRRSARLDSNGQESPGIYRNTSQCGMPGCGRHWHDHCRQMWEERVGSLRPDARTGLCPACPLVAGAPQGSQIPEAAYRQAGPGGPDGEPASFRDLPAPPRDFREDVDYVMVDPALGSLGVSAGTVPNAGQSYGVRVAYQSNMCLQSLDSQPGILSKRGINAKESLGAEVSLVGSELDDYLQHDNHNGANMLCVSRMMPYNNEDGLYVCETAAREIFRYRHVQSVVAPASQKDKPIRHNMKWYIVLAEYMGISDAVDKGKFHAIDPSTGLPRIGAFLNPGDALYARYAVTKDGTIVDRSEYCSTDVFGYVHQLDVRGMNFDPANPNKIPVTSGLYVAVSLSLQYCYMLGDKLCARVAQKGVIAMVLPRRLMGRIQSGPFKGCVPDMICAPTMLPTRMTPGLVTEQYAGTVALLRCKPQDATTFRRRMGLPDEFRVTGDPEIKRFTRILEEEGYMTGLMQEMVLPNGSVEMVACGPIRYLMLRHHAVMKIKRSPYDPRKVGGGVFRQNTSGREGGLRIGAQESQGYYSQGTPYMLQNLISMGASKQKLLLCEGCGLFATLPPMSGLRHTCDNCHGELLAVDTVYSLVVMLHILATRGIDMRFFPIRSQT